MDQHPLNIVLILLACSVAAIALFRRLHLPPILGYLTVGILTGPYALGWVPEGEAIHLLAEVGMVFLLFMIGLEVSIPHLMAMKGTVLGMGGAQVIITTLLAGGIALLFGIPWQGALVLGGVVAVSSTAIAARQMVEQLEIQSRHGRTALAILLFQDLAVVPFLVAIPILAGAGDQPLWEPLLLAMAKGTLAFLLMVGIGYRLLPRLLHAVAIAHSIELFTLAILFVALAAAALTYQFGLSLALGAFLAGIMLGETEYRHLIEVEVRPFRDVLMGLFFVSVGAQLDVGALPAIWPWVLAITIGLILGKAIIVVTVTRAGGLEPGVALRTALVLAQGGEFGFALLTLGITHGLFTAQATQPLLTAIVFSMILAPLIIRYNGAMAKRVCTGYLGQRVEEMRRLSGLTEHLSGHVIICGFGRIGQNLALFLKEEGFTYVALDIDPVLVRTAGDAGDQVFYGDSGKAEVLQAAGIDRAKALVVTLYDPHLTGQIVQAARKASADLMIVARTHHDQHMEALEAAGANDVVPESLEASMMLAAHALRHMGVARDDIRALIDKSRLDHYRRLRGVFHGEEVKPLAKEGDNYRLQSVVLTDNCMAIGMTIGELGLDRYDIKVVALRRHGIRGETPDPSILLQPNDTLVLQGPAKLLQQGEQLLLTEP